jgi:tRNA-splicing ligase RtcB
MNPKLDSQPGLSPEAAIRVPIRCFGGERLRPDEPAQRQLDELAALPGVREVTVLPDVHYKSRNPAPSGTVVVTEGVIVPRAIDDGMNCGMRSMATELSASEFTPRLLDELFGRLLATIPPKKHEQPLLDERECEEMLVHGLGEVVEALDLPPDECLRTENGGRFDLGIAPEEIRAALPRKPIAKYRGSVGALGAGNHFLELQEVVEVVDVEAARRLGLTKGQAVFMMHSDSGKLGKRVLAEVHAEAERLHRAPGGSELFGIPVDSELGRRYLACLTATLHTGFANRAAITELVRRALREVLGDSSLRLSLVGDSGHETIQPEVHGGRELWVHRHGASHALPPSPRVGDPALRDLGTPIPLAGCLGADSFICLGRPGNARTFHSAPHGAGRVLGKDESASRFDPDVVEADVRSRGVRLYRYHSDNIAGQAPWGFKNVSDVVQAMSSQDLLRPVVRVRPIAALKG